MKTKFVLLAYLLLACLMISCKPRAASTLRDDQAKKVEKEKVFVGLTLTSSKDFINEPFEGLGVKDGEGCTISVSESDSSENGGKIEKGKKYTVDRFLTGNTFTEVEGSNGKIIAMTLRVVASGAKPQQVLIRMAADAEMQKLYRDARRSDSDKDDDSITESDQLGIVPNTPAIKQYLFGIRLNLSKNCPSLTL